MSFAPGCGGHGGERDRGSIAAVILNWNQAELTLQCVSCVRGQVDHMYVVHNDSHPSDRMLLEGVSDERITLIVNSVNAGYSGGCNLGVRAAVEAGFDYILIMNNDAFPDSGAVERLRAHLNGDARLGAVGPTVVRRATREVLHVDCSLNMRTGSTRWKYLDAPPSTLPKAQVTTDYIGGEVLLARAATLEAVGLFDERFFSYYEDVEWGVRAARGGWRLEIVPDAIFEHMVGASSPSRMGLYYRARNLPLFLRIATGRSRTGAILSSTPWMLLALASLLRRGRVTLAFGGVIPGWLAGAIMSF